MKARPIITGLVTALAVAGLALFWGRITGRDRFADLYASLHTAPLPAELQERPEIAPLLERLRQDHCDGKAAADLAAALVTQDDSREAASLLAGFTETCPGFDGLTFKAADLYYSLADYPAAREVSDRLIAQWPDSAPFHYQAGQIDLALGHADEAAAEIRKAVDLSADRRALDRAVFFDLAKALAQLGKFCEAAAAIQQFVSLDPKQRDDFASQKPIAEYLLQGNCVE